MQITKPKESFNMYKAEFSYAELQIMARALQSTPGLGPEADEMLKGFEFYFDKLPQPGEDPKPKETTNSPDMAKSAADQALDPMLLDEPPGDQEGGPGPEMGQEDDGQEAPLEPEAEERGSGMPQESLEVLPEPPIRLNLRRKF